jgi:hypothetical protein
LDERRNAIRLATDKHLKILDDGTNKYIGMLANLSTDGIMVVSSEKIVTSSVFKCRIELLEPILDCNQIVVEANQRWSRKNVDKGWWESGYKVEAVGKDRELLSYLNIAFAVEKWKIPGVKNVSTSPAENLRKTTRYEVKDRYPVYQKLTYHEIGKLADLSIAGSSFITKNYIKKGTFLSCKVRLPQTMFQQDYLFFDAECRWCKKCDDTGSYKSGYKLHNVSKHDEVIILYLILHYLEEKESKQKYHLVEK